MTMITGYHLKRGGFLQADILLTSPNTWMSPSQIPSFQSDTEGSTLAAHTVVGLCQKILVVNDHFAVAFAGDVPDIQDAIRQLDKLLAEDSELTGKRFLNALVADERLKKANLKAIALSVEDDEIQITSYCADFGCSNEHFELYVGGSGAAHAIEHHESYLLAAFDVPEEDIVVHGTCMALHQFANHLVDEFENKFESETIANLFGGGFEVVAYHGGQFHKISDVVYAFAEAKLDSKGILQIDFPQFLLKSTYEGDDLKIRSLEIHCDEDEEDYVARNDRTFTIAPVTRYRDTYVEECCDDINFLGEFLCYLIRVNTPSGVFTTPFIRKYDKHIGFLCKAFCASVHEGNVRITYSDTFREEVEAHVHEFMRQLRHSLESE
ncbi:hypothetical protein FBY21_1651 [Pseudomonas sp. SLBN-26]|uniref:hypothetical protein n=1 Tax=Pseudomonadaceae TaxID=135621 RepID=UPI00114D60A2|nr:MULTISPECIES: hypothetical protein [Pseudomonas]MCP1617049.1 hypothetical protein [Pseudomonas otitidis]TQL06293.1 hypothetical protein FBY21_1651 [Pseudomonas sp. SLBN-26]